MSPGKLLSQPAAEVERLLAALEQLRTAGQLTKASIDKALGREKGYYGHLLAGRIVLTVEHVYAILQALQVDPGAFFAALHPSAGQGSDVAALRATFLDAERFADRSALRYLADRLRAKGVLDDADAQELFRRLEGHAGPTGEDRPPRSKHPRPSRRRREPSTGHDDPA